jgi:tetratricopeptide (TPR) repeat protein
MRNAIAWSYERLNRDEQRVFGLLSVFAGGFTAEAAHAIAGGADEAALQPTLAALQDASLINCQPLSGDVRFTMLETIREFAADQLSASGDLDAARRRSADYFVALAERAQDGMRSTGQVQWLDILDRDHENLGEALTWHLKAEDDTALRLVVALGEFWELRGYLGEGRRRLAAALAGRDGAPPALRARAMDAAGLLAARQGDYVAAGELVRDGLAVWREIGDAHAVAGSLRRLGGLAWDLGDATAARRYYEQSLVIARDLDDQRTIAGALNNLGMVAAGEGDYPAARALYEECLPLFRAVNDEANCGNVLLNMGLAADNAGEHSTGRASLDESLTTFRSIGYRSGIALALFNIGNQSLALGGLDEAEASYRESLALYRDMGAAADATYALFGLGKVAHLRGDHASARAFMGESLALRIETGENRPIAANLVGLAGVDRAEGQPEQAVRLLSAAATLRESLGIRMHPSQCVEFESETAALRLELGDTAFASAWEQGGALSALEALVLCGPGGPE